MQGRLLSLFAASAVFMTMSGCHHDPAGSNSESVVWKTEVRSPDGAWLATAYTDQIGEFGGDYIETVVTLKELNGTVNRGEPFDILEYNDGGPIRKDHTLSQENAGGGVSLAMRWTTASHLEIDYSGNINPDLQVVRFGGVDISLHQRTGGSAERTERPN